MAPIDRAFGPLIAQVDDCEGAKISAVSAAAHSIVQNLR